MIVLLSAGLTLLGQQGKVTLHAPNWTVEQVVAAIAEQTHRPLRVAAVLKYDRVVIEAENVGPNELLSAIAAADGAQWIADAKQGPILSRPAELVRSEAKREVQMLAKQLNLDLTQKLPQMLAPGKQKDGPSAADRMAWRVFQMLGAERVASVEPDTMVVLTKNPNRLQQSFPGDLDPLIAQFRAEEKQYPPQNLATPPEGVPEFVPGPIAKTFVSISYSQLQGYMVRVTMLDGHSKVVDHGRAVIPRSDMNLDAFMKSPGGDKNAGENQPLKLSPAVNEALGVFQKAMSNQGMAGFSKELVTAFLDPEHHDPMSFVATELVAGMTRARNRSLVAVLPDSMFITSTVFGMLKPTPNNVSGWLSGACVLDESKPGWTVVTPRFPTESRDVSVNRSELGRFVREAHRQGGARLVDYTQYLGNQSRRYMAGLGLFYTFFVEPSVAQMVNPDGIQAARLFGKLTPSQQQALIGKGKVLARDLSADARDELFRWILYRDATNSMVWQRGNDYIEPSEYLANGLPGDFALTAEVDQSAKVIAIVNGREDLHGPVDAVNLGLKISLGEMSTKDALFRMGNSLNLMFKAGTSPKQSYGALVSTRFSELFFDRSKPPVPFAQLPKAFIAEVDRGRTINTTGRPVEPGGAPPTTP